MPRDSSESTPLLRHAQHAHPTALTTRSYSGEGDTPRGGTPSSSAAPSAAKSRFGVSSLLAVALAVALVLAISLGHTSTLTSWQQSRSGSTRDALQQREGVAKVGGSVNFEAATLGTGDQGGYKGSPAADALPSSAANGAASSEIGHAFQADEPPAGGAASQQLSGAEGLGWRSQGLGSAPGVSATATAAGPQRDQDRVAEGDEGQAGGTETGAATAASAHGAPRSGSSAGSKPNVFFFLIDDMGHGDIGYQSTDLKGITPNLDALAAGGIKLSNYYSVSLCTPARGSLMTGRYPVRFGMQYGVIVPGAPWGLPLNEKVFPEYMNDAGYESHMVGKWHLGSYNDASLPSRRGFKTYMGYLNGEETYYTHKNIESYLDGESFYDFGFGNETDYYDISKIVGGVACSGPTMTKSDVGGVEYLGSLMTGSPADSCYTGTYSTDAFLGRARQIVKDKTPLDEEPLFLYVAHQSVHAPNGPAPLEGFTPEEQELLTATADRATTTNRGKFAGVLMYLDKRIGEFMDMLEAEGWMENSIIVVASDNGGCPKDGGSNYPLRGSKQSQFEGGTKVPAFVWSKSHIPEELWGTTYDNMMHVSDWLPTLTSAGGGEVTGSAGPLDGVDHWTSLTSVDEGVKAKTKAPRDEMLYNWDPYLLSTHEELVEDPNLPQAAFRQGNWKLLVNAWCSGFYSEDPDVIASDRALDPKVTCGTTAACQDCTNVCQTDPKFLFGDRLFNLDLDPREQHDVLSEYPEIAARLRARAEEIVFAEYMPSGFLPVNTDSYRIWASSGWWMVPWVERLAEQKKVETYSKSH